MAKRWATAAVRRHRSDVAVSPKISETEGNGKLFNYMAAGLPTVCFDNPVNLDILGDDGIYVKERDAESFARAILETLHAEEAAEALGMRLKKRAEERAWAREKGTMIRVYREASERRGQGSQHPPAAAAGEDA